MQRGNLIGLNQSTQLAHDSLIDRRRRGDEFKHFYFRRMRDATILDLDRDGDIDYIALNAGLNTMYSAAPGRPTLLYYGSVDGSKDA